jgi:hypothetical protein
MALATIQHATPSQYASAAMHLDRRSEWRTYLVDGTRYVAILSGRSNRVYAVRADSRGCSCDWYKNGGQQCSHMLSLHLAALEDELVEESLASEAEIDCHLAGIKATHDARAEAARQYFRIWSED